jgi:hypothetical protein
MEDLGQKWTQWKRQQHLYPDINTWWSRYCKKRIRVMIQYVEAERRWDHNTMENFYYECLNDILREANIHGANILALNHIKAKIVKLHSTRLQTSFLDTTEADQLAAEQPTLFQLIQMQKRRTARTVRSVRDDIGFIQTSPKGIALAFTTFLRAKYDNIEVDAERICTLSENVRVDHPTDYEDIMENPLTLAKYTKPFTLVGGTGLRPETGLGSNSIRPHGQPYGMTSV